MEHGDEPQQSNQNIVKQAWTQKSGRGAKRRAPKPGDACMCAIYPNLVFIAAKGARGCLKA